MENVSFTATTLLLTLSTYIIIRNGQLPTRKNLCALFVEKYVEKFEMHKKKLIDFRSIPNIEIPKDLEGQGAFGGGS